MPRAHPLRWLFGAVLSCLGVARAESDPTELLVRRALQDGGAPVFFGASDRSPLALARDWATLSQAPDPVVEGQVRRHLLPEIEAARKGNREVRWRLQPRGALGAGDLVPDYRNGDTWPGLVSLRAGADARLYLPWVEASLAPELRLDAGGLGGATPLRFDAALSEAWAGLAAPSWQLGFGLRPRWIGPGHLGSLMWTDNTRPPPMGDLAGRAKLPGPLGHIHGELGLGWLDGDRGDVTRPGLLLMDLRYLPVPWLELGATRMSIFGGVGRPPTRFTQLLVPTEPHVYDDPDQELPDQDELAAVDMRLHLPIGRWGHMGSSRTRLDGIDHLELWWQYGAEDVISRETGGVSLPSLAGVANLYGAEIAAGPLVVVVEHARILDDYFRWYTGHRIYHEGFTRAGRPMGQAAGGDSLSWAASIRWDLVGQGLELRGEQVRRVGVVEASGEHLFALSADELRWRLEIRGWRRAGALAWWRVGIAVEQTRNLDFQPGRDDLGFALELGR